MTTLSDIRQRIRRDLNDLDSDTYRWDDDQLDRHIDHALSELCAAMPGEHTATLATTPGSRELSLAGLEGLVDIEAVEYPIGQYPPTFTGFATWAETLVIHTDTSPAGGDARLYYTARHTLDGEGTTLSAFQADVLVTGAAAYAALEQSAYRIDRLNTGGPDAADRYAAYGRARLTAFQQLLRQYGRRNRVKARRLVAPA